MKTKLWERCLAFALACMMLFSMLPVQAFATETGEDLHEDHGDGQIIEGYSLEDEDEGDEPDADLPGDIEEEEEHVHDWVVAESKDATCGEAGYIMYICSCEESKTDEVTATGEHSYEAGEPVAATPEAQGYTPYICSVCGATEKGDFVNYQEPDQSDDHEHEFVAGEPVAATPDADGYTLYTCSCGESYQDDFVEYVAPNQDDAPFQRVIPEDWSDEMVEIQALIDEYIEYYLGYYGFKMFDETKFAPIIQAQIEAEDEEDLEEKLAELPEELTAEWETICAQIEDIIANQMDDNERENARMAVEEVVGFMMYYHEAELLTDEQGEAIMVANPVFMEFADLAFEHGVEISALVSGEFTVANGNIKMAFSGNNGSDKGSKKSETAAWFQAYASGFWGGSTNNITVTNASADKNAIISFDFSVSGDCSTHTINGQSYTKSGSGSYTSGELAPGASFKLVITGKGGFSSGAEVQYNLTSITWTEVVPDPKVTVNFDSTMGGVTVGGTAVSSGTVTEVETGGSIVLAATKASGVSFAGWVDGTNKILSTAESYTLSPVADMTVKPIYYIDGGNAVFATGVTTDKSYDEKKLTSAYQGTEFPYKLVTRTHLFEDLAAALASASSGDSKTVVLVNNGTVSGNYTIPSGVTLLIPCDDDGTLSGTNPLFRGDNLVQTPVDNITAYRTLTMASGSSITVASGGAMNVNAVLFAIGGSEKGGGSPLSGYGYVKMENGSNITVQSGGKLYTYGYINGSGTVTAKSGSKVYEVFQFEDFRGGTVTTSMSQDTDYAVFPLSDYYVQNIMVPLTLEAGATEGSYAAIYMSNASFGTGVEFISSGNAMFNLKSGSVTKRYDHDRDRLVFDVDGEVEIAGISMTIESITMKSSDFVLPINSNMTVNLVGGSLSVQQGVAILPGAEINVKNGANCTLVDGGALYLYDTDEWGNFVSANPTTFIPVHFVPEREHTMQASELKDAQITIEGSVTAKGDVFTTAGGAAIKGTEGAVIHMTPATSGITYQFDQNEYHEFSLSKGNLTPAQLQNGDNTYYKTSDTPKDADGNYLPGYYIYEDGQWHYRCKDNIHTPGAEATCGDPQVCTICNAEIKPATGNHAPGAAATCTTAQTCTTCGDEVMPAMGHSYKTVPAVADSCKEGETGYLASQQCTRCNLHFSDTAGTLIGDGSEAAFETWKQGDGKVDDAQHTWGSAVELKAPTCTEMGINRYTCSVCGATKDEIEIAAKGHSPKKGDICKAATCDQPGITDYWYCSGCNTYYLDEACTADKAIAVFDTWLTTVGQGVIPAKGHNITEHAEVPAKCDAYGTKAYYSCSVCGNYYSGKTGDSYSGEIANLTTWLNTVSAGKIDMLPHTEEAVAEQEATCLAAGYEAGVKCSVCKKVLSGCTEIPKLSHQGAEQAGKAADCTTDGWKTYYQCTSDCGEYYEDEACTKRIGDADALATWKTGAGKIAALGHNLVLVPEVAKTCTTDGTKAYYQCQAEGDRTVECGAVFEDAQGQTPIADLATWKVIPAAHTPGETETKILDETTGIYESVVYCAVEGCMTDGKRTEFSSTVVVPDAPSGHTLKLLERMEPTCYSTGLTAGAECTDHDCAVCQASGATYSVAQTEIPMLPHTVNPSAIKAEWNADYTKCTVSATCVADGCGASITETVDATETARVAATCDAAGSVTYTAAAVTEQVFITAGYTIAPKTVALTQLTHDWGEVDYQWSTDYETCTATQKCARQSADSCTRTETVNSTSVTIGSSCTASGYTTYTAAFTQAWHEAANKTQKMIVDGAPATGHTYTVDRNTVDWTVNGENTTCTADLKCNVCEEASAVVKATATVVMKTVKAATCEEQGEILYTATFTAPEGHDGSKLENVTTTEYPAALNHDWTYSYSWSADHSTCTATRTCGNDPAHKNEETVASVVTGGATCTQAGTLVYTATFRNANGEGFAVQTERVTQDALGHDAVKVDAKPSSCAVKGEQGNNEYYTCSRCLGVFADSECTVTTTVVAQKLPLENCKFENYVYDGDATCVADGHMTAECSYGCGTTDNKLDPDHKMTGHNYDAGVILEGNAPTCTETGIRTYTCINTWCESAHTGHTKTETVAATGHALVAMDGQESTCDETGYIAYYQCAATTRTGERTFCGNYFAKETDTAADATPIATTETELTAWQEGDGALPLRQCKDEDFDHDCDYTDCDKPVRQHKDDDTDHLCDTYGENCRVGKIGDHADSSTDQDHLCDYCREQIGGHEYISGVCNCGYVQDLKVTITIEAKGSNPKLHEESIKYGNGGADYTTTLDLSSFGNCFIITGVSAKVGGADAAIMANGNDLTIASDLLTGDVVITVAAQQTHVLERLEIEETKPATCEDAGVRTIKLYCEKCTQVYYRETETVPAKGHNYVSVYTEPTFDADGYTTYTCQNGCGGSYVDTDEGSKLINPVAMVGAQKFATLEEAIEAAGGKGAIILLDKYTVEGDQTWDLQKAQLYIPAIDGNYGLIVKGNLTIKGGTYVAEGMRGIGVQPAGSLTIEGGNFEVWRDSDYLIGSWGTTVINNGEFEGQYNCVNAFAGTVTINGGTFETEDFDCTGEWESSDVFAEDVGTASITGGTFSKSVEDYLAEGYCQVEGRYAFEVDAHEPRASFRDQEVAATCDTDGSYDLVTECDRCDAEISRVTNEIPATGHTVEVIDGLAADCQNAGYSEAYYCSVCDAYFATRLSDKELADKITVALTEWRENDGRIDPLPHKPYTISATEVTCETNGNNQYYKCRLCRNAFEDEACTIPTTDADQVIGALGHDYEGVETLTPSCTAAGEMTYTCKNDPDHTYTEPLAALNHEWDEGNILAGDEATCTEDGTKTFTCARGCTKTETVSKTGHKGEQITGKVRTCTEAGWSQYHQCQNSCGLYYVDKACSQLIGDDAALEVWKTGDGKIPAAGHNYQAVAGKTNDCVEDGYLASQQCTRCKLHFSDNEGTLIGDGSEAAYQAWIAEGGEGYLAAKGHKPGEVQIENVVDAKCETDGSHDEVTYCTVCTGEVSRTTVVDPMTGHTGLETIPGKDSTCTVPGLTDGVVCTVCGEIQTVQEVISAKGHKPGEVQTENVVDAKCETDGSHDEVIYCTVCTGEISRTAVVDPMTGHTGLETIPGKEPTCTETGLTEGEKCTVCGEEQQAQEIVPATGHRNVTVTEQQDATCTVDGVKEYYYCADCGKYFAARTSETELSAQINDLAKWKAGNGKIAKLNHPTTEIIPAVAPTCTEDGLKAGVKCTVCGDAVVEQEVDPAKGHNKITDEAVAPTCTATGLSEGEHCSRCDWKVEQEIIPATGHLNVTTTAQVDPDCTNDGVKEHYYCADCGKYFAAKVSDTVLSVEIADLTAWKSTSGKLGKLGHQEEDIPAVAPTCTETGLTVGKYCPVCDTTTVAQDEVPAAGHKEVIDGKVDPTCTETGLTEGKHCSVCDEPLVPQETVDALGHTVEPVAGAAAKCEQDGWKDHFQCQTCKAYFADEAAEQPIEDLKAWKIAEDGGKIPMLGHAWDEGRVTTLPDCEAEGFRTFTCGNCNGTKEEVEPALGHIVVINPAKAPTYTSPGWEEYETCDRPGCDHNTMVAIPALGEPEITNFDEFIENLAILEDIADTYVKKVAPGKDPAMLVIKYIRTGVDRYNSGSWNIMAGYEDSDFAEYVRKYEEAYNAELAEGEEMMMVSGMKNINEFSLPNGDWADIGHVFGSMDITYTNKTSIDHADVSGWAGDTVDLMSMVDQFGWESTNLEDMIKEINTKYFLKFREDFEEEPVEGTFSNTDMEGDLDAFYVMQTFYGREYENGTLTDIFSSYMTPSLTSEDRAAFFLNKRLGGVTLRSDVRDAVYNEVLGNSVVATLEGTRPFKTTDITQLRKACCYVVADYLCRLAGDFIEIKDNEYFHVFQTETSTLAPGIVQKINHANTADGKTMVYYTATGDVTSGNVHVYANYHNNDPAGGWAMQRVIDQANIAQEKYGNPESEHYIENYNVIASINGAGYDMYTGEPSGVLVMNGKEYHPIGASGFFGILDDGTAMIGSMAEYNELQAEGRVKEAIATFGDLIRDGKIIASDGGDRASRTAIGVTATGKVVFMVLDGRQGDLSCGGNMKEIAQIMLEAGCHVAVNLDGGGSSTYVAKEAGESELAVVSKPSDGISRSVSTSLLMVSTAPDSSAFDRAVIDSNYSFFTVNSTDTFTATAISVTGNVVDMPEGTEWAVSNGQVGSITPDGVFTAKSRGTAEVQLKLNGAVIGSKKINVVNPDNVYFEKSTINAIYGQPIELPVRVAYEGKAVAFNEADVTLSLADAAHGSVDGFSFTGNEASGLRSIKVMAELTCDPSVVAVINMAMYTKDEASFDFENASGGDLQLSWVREVSNSNMEGTSVYRSIDRDEPMKTNYTFAMDMSRIEMPAQLKDLTYMLPGADVEGNNTAWSFLLQLAERVSVLTEVTPVLYFDKNLDVDYSKLSINNEYFYLKEAIFNEEENSLTLVMKWHRQVKPIDIDAANPMCIVTGITLTPKEDAAWNSNDALVLMNKGTIGYDIYLRANALYSFSSKPENQEIYGLYPFTNVREDGVQENGGHFKSVYKEFEDQYTLLNGIKEGWVVEGGGFAYYVNGEKYTGIREIDGFYYDFGENGVNIGQKKYTGVMTDAQGNEFYLVDGLMYTGWMIKDMKDVKYYNPETGIREKLTEAEVPSTCIIDGHCVYTSESGATKRIDYDDAGGHDYVKQANGSYVCELCGYLRIEMKDVSVKLSYYTATYSGTAKTPGTTATAPDGRVLTKPGQSTHPDYYSTYKNNVDVGTASVTLTASKYGKYSNLNDWRGNAAGEITVTYEIRPDAPAEAKLQTNGTDVIFSWTAAKAPGVTYVIYVSADGTNWTELATTTDLSYTMNEADAAGKIFRVGTRKIVNGKTYESLNKAEAPAIVVSIGTTEEGKPTLTWNATKGAKEFHVYRSNTQDGNFNRVFVTKGTSYTHASAVAGNSYYYYVKVILTNGTELVSEVVSNTFSAPVEKIEVTTDHNTDGKPLLKWTAVSGAVKYRVYRSNTEAGNYVYVFETKGQSYTHISAKVGNSYFYYVKAVKGDGTEVDSEIVTNTCIEPETEFTITTGNNAEGKPILKWTAATGADHYEVYRSTTENGTYVKVFSTTGRSYTHVSATAGRTYYYKVKIVSKDGTELFSPVVANSCLIPNAGFSIVTGHNVAGKPTLKWKAIAGAARYEVYRSNTLNGEFVKVFSTKGTTYTNSSAKAGNTYYYKLKVYLVDGTEKTSDVMTNTCLVPGAVFNITTGHNADGKPTLKWSAIVGATNYEVYRSETSDGEFVKTFSTKGTTYTNTAAKAGNTYYYKLKVYLADGTEKTSDVVSNICLIPGVVFNVETGNNAEGKPTLKWTPIVGADHYEVYRANSVDGEYVLTFTTKGTTYTNIGAKAGNTYYYKLVVYLADGTSETSEIYSNVCLTGTK